jgi:hypothetical protein
MHIGLFGSEQSFALRYVLYIFTNLRTEVTLFAFSSLGLQTIVTYQDQQIQSSQFIQTFNIVFVTPRKNPKEDQSSVFEPPEPFSPLENNTPVQFFRTLATPNVNAEHLEETQRDIDPALGHTC